MVLIAGVLLLIFTVLSQLALKTAQRFEAEGHTTSAQVSERYITTRTDADGDQSTSYWLTFTYVISDKQEITLTQTVGTSLYRRVQTGDSFDLLYLASDPHRVETSPGSNRASSKVAQSVALLFGAVWLVSLWKVGGWAVAAFRARQYGTRETVKVTRIHRTSFKVNKKSRYRLKWEDSAGRKGASLMHKSRDLSGINAGDMIDIYQGVKQSWWIGDVGERDR